MCVAVCSMNPQLYTSDQKTNFAKNFTETFHSSGNSEAGLGLSLPTSPTLRLVNNNFTEQILSRFGDFTFSKVL